MEHQVRVVKYKGARIHVGCGGIVMGRTCLKCGEEKPRRNLTRAVFGEGPLVSSEKKKFDEKDYRKRIKEGRDIFR